jgi:NADH:ubiquinone oxidoreductase subunit F (NADH-binding)
MTQVVDEGMATTTRVPEGTNRLFLAGEEAKYRAHTAAYGALHTSGIGEELIGELDRSGLTGRGGAGFAVARKFGAMHSRRGHLWPSSAVVIANGAEGEPRSLKDETLLRHAPHLVIDGLLAAGAAVNAAKLYLYATAASLEPVRHAIAERRDAHRIRLVEAPDTFVSGEASAVVNAIATGTALPTDRVQRLTASGLKQKPTLVHNVETLAHVALIARFGSDWFRSVGTPQEPGTRLVTISGAVPQDRVLEVAGDARVLDIVTAVGAIPASIAAVLVGGYHGAWLTPEHLGVGLSKDGLAPYGAQPGAGILYVLDVHKCGLRFSAEVTRYLANESAGQCGPCKFGLPEMATLLERIASGDRDPSLAHELREVGQSVLGRGSCHHPNGTVRFTTSTLTAFASDAQAHLHGQCLRASTGRAQS